MSEVDKLVANNSGYAEAFDRADAPKAPQRHVAVVACMDARLDIYRLLGIGLGEAHVIRNAGGVITEDAIRSLMISQRFLDTREIMLIHHTDCGMLTLQEEQTKAEIEQETGVRPPFSLESFGSPEDDVRQSARRLQASPFLSHKDGIRGFLYEVETGSLREVE